MIDYKFSKNEYQKLIKRIEEDLKDKDILEKANKIDFNHSNRQVEIEKLIEIVEMYKCDEIKNDGEIKKYLVEYNGDFYTTLQLCLIAILNKIQMILDVNDFMLAEGKIPKNGWPFRIFEIARNSHMYSKDEINKIIEICFLLEKYMQRESE